MIRISKHQIQKSLLYVSAFILILILFLLLFRNLLFSFYLHKKIDRFNKAYQADLCIKQTRITGLASAMMTGITLGPVKGDTLLKVDSAFVEVNIWKLLTGKLVIRNVEVMNSFLTLVRKDTLTNYLFLLHDRKERTESESRLRNLDYAEATNRLSGFIFNRIPQAMRIRNLTVSGRTDRHTVKLQVEQFILDDHRFKTPVRVQEEDSEATWWVGGQLDNHDHLVEFMIWSADSIKMPIPYLKYKWNACVRFDSLRFNLVERKNRKDRTNLYGTIAVTGLELNHEKIAATTVAFDNLGITFAVNVGSDFIELDSVSRVIINKLDFHPYIRYRPGPEKQITLRIDKPEFPAQDLFSSLPRGLFTNLEGMKVKGNLTWYLHFFVDLSLPDALQFETELRRQGFSVISYGSTDPAMISGPFLYTAYEKGLPVRVFMVGPENPDFRPLDRISPFLQVSVLCSEDGGFYQHRGFLPDAFRESIITNIKERRFVRGGSTITMQLVKNVFLNRNKTIARKLEEALLVWLIENQGLCTKDRMLEVYLNIIEWGPLIYGANEAARFYFTKDASRLTLAESIFLASIIPRPKWFRYSFDESRHLNESQKEFYRLVSEKMLAKGWITLKDYEQLIPDVELKGPAKLILRKTDLVPADSLSLIEEMNE